MNDSTEPGSAIWAMLEMKKDFDAFKASNAALTEALRDLIKVMSAPVTRESTIRLPSGPVSMTVKESK